MNFMNMKAKADDGIMDLAWLPQVFKCLGQLHTLDSWGSMWLLAALKFGYRYEPDFFVHCGIGRLIFGVGGRTLAIMWSMADTITSKTDLNEVQPMISRLTTAKAKSFMKNAVWVCIEVIPPAGAFYLFYYLF